MDDSLRGDGDVVIEVCHAVAVFVDDLAVFVDTEGAAGSIGVVVFFEDFVDLGGLAGREGLGLRQAGSEEKCGQGSKCGDALHGSLMIRRTGWDERGTGCWGWLLTRIIFTGWARVRKMKAGLELERQIESLLTNST